MNMSNTARLFVVCVLLSVAVNARGESKHAITLEEALAMARSNPRVELAEQQVQEAQARVREARASWYPRARALSFLAPSPKITCLDPACSQTDPVEAPLAFSGIFAGLDLRVVQPVFTSGKLSSAMSAARHGVEMAHSQKASVADQQVSQVARAFYGAKLSRELIIMLKEGRQDIKEAESLIEKKLEDGSPDVDLQDQYRVHTLMAEVDARLAEANQAYATALAGLRALVGDDKVTIESGPLETLEEELVTSSESYRSSANEKRPELRLARETKLAAAALLDLEKAKLWPDLALVGEVKLARAQGVDNPPSAFANDPYDRSTAGLALVLNWEIDPAVHLAQADRARARTSQAEQLVQLVSRAVRFDVEQAFASATQARLRWKASQDGAHSANAWLVSVLQAQALGLTETKDLADALLAHFTMRSRVLEATHDWNIALIDLRRASGRLTQPLQKRQSTP